MTRPGEDEDTATSGEQKKRPPEDVTVRRAFRRKTRRRDEVTEEFEPEPEGS